MEQSMRRTIIAPCITCIILMALLSIFCGESAAQPQIWQRLDSGLYLGEFDPKKKSNICNHKIVILKINPKFYSFKLLSASQHGLKPRTTKEWCNEFGLTAAINASMYQSMDLLKSTGYMKNRDHFNNAHINKSFGSFMVFNPIDQSIPEVQLIDRRLRKDWETIMNRYNTVVQNYRMISNGKKRGWPQQDTIYSAAAIGMDQDGHVLFILSRSLHSTHDFIHILLSLPINIRDAMYVEGGPEAALYLKLGHREMNLRGTCEKDFTKYVDNGSFFQVPNIIGVSKRMD